MKLSKYKACICEGSSEEAIIDILLDNDLLIFKREELIEEKVIRCRNGKTFEERYLRKSFDDKVTIFRILDSRRENFNISKAYKNKVDVINVITAPEIEMLIIHSEGMYNKFKNSKLKPSEFCKSALHIKNIKSYEFIKEYFKSPDKLLKAINEYKRVVPSKKRRIYLS